MAEENSVGQNRQGVADIVFLIDATGSMGPCIKDLRNNIRTFIKSLQRRNSTLREWRISICFYRDYTYDDEYIKINDFTDDADVIESQLESVKASGGADEPESLLDALFDVINRGTTEKGVPAEPHKWRSRDDATRCIVVFSDASFQEKMSEETLPNGTVADIVELLQRERIWLSLFVPAMPCYSQLATAERCEYFALEYDSTDRYGAIAALMNFTSDKVNFKRVLEQLGKDISERGA